MVEWDQEYNLPIDSYRNVSLADQRKINFKQQKEKSISVRIDPSLYGKQPQGIYDSSSITSERVMLS